MEPWDTFSEIYPLAHSHFDTPSTYLNRYQDNYLELQLHQATTQTPHNLDTIKETQSHSQLDSISESTAPTTSIMDKDIFNSTHTEEEKIESSIQRKPHLTSVEKSQEEDNSINMIEVEEEITTDESSTNSSKKPREQRNESKCKVQVHTLQMRAKTQGNKLSERSSKIDPYSMDSSKPAGTPYIHVHVHGMKADEKLGVLSMIDTGANKSLISTTLYSQLLENSQLDYQQLVTQYTPVESAFKGNNPTCIGQIELTLTIFGNRNDLVEYPHTFYVCDKLNHPMYIGSDFLTNEDWLSHQTATSVTIFKPFSLTKETLDVDFVFPSRMESFPLKIKTPTFCPKGKLAFIPLELTNNAHKENNTYGIYPNRAYHHLHPNLSIVDTLVTISDKDQTWGFYIRNNGVKDTLIRREQFTITASSLDKTLKLTEISKDTKESKPTYIGKFPQNDIYSPSVQRFLEHKRRERNLVKVHLPFLKAISHANESLSTSTTSSLVQEKNAIHNYRKNEQSTEFAPENKRIFEQTSTNSPSTIIPEKEEKESHLSNENIQAVQAVSKLSTQATATEKESHESDTSHFIAPLTHKTTTNNVATQKSQSTQTCITNNEKALNRNLPLTMASNKDETQMNENEQQDLANKDPLLQNIINNTIKLSTTQEFKDKLANALRDATQHYSSNKIKQAPDSYEKKISMPVFYKPDPKCKPYKWKTIRYRPQIRPNIYTHNINGREYDLLPLFYTPPKQYSAPGWSLVETDNDDDVIDDFDEFLDINFEDALDTNLPSSMEQPDPPSGITRLTPSPMVEHTVCFDSQSHLGGLQVHSSNDLTLELSPEINNQSTWIQPRKSTMHLPIPETPRVAMRPCPTMILTTNEAVKSSIEKVNSSTEVHTCVYDPSHMREKQKHNVDLPKGAIMEKPNKQLVTTKNQNEDNEPNPTKLLMNTLLEIYIQIQFYVKTRNKLFTALLNTQKQPSNAARFSLHVNNYEEHGNTFLVASITTVIPNNTDCIDPTRNWDKKSTEEGTTTKQRKTFRGTADATFTPQRTEETGIPSIGSGSGLVTNSKTHNEERTLAVTTMCSLFTGKYWQAKSNPTELSNPGKVLSCKQLPILDETSTTIRDEKTGMPLEINLAETLVTWLKTLSEPKKKLLFQKHY